ncbi:hypothetical protein [Paenarthrobacter sp. YIM B13468]|uniref:hypothetical protein n=1 Tax=Paenarthrobacter sp. YIM B13468 TaxID=3366295 RepID=UPI00366AC20B
MKPHAVGSVGAGKAAPLFRAPAKAYIPGTTTLMVDGGRRVISDPDRPPGRNPSITFLH